MSKQCAICGKSPQSGSQVSHSHIRTKRTWKPNIQRVKILVDGTPQKTNVCTRCLKTGKVKRAQ